MQQWKLNRLSTYGMLNGLKQSQVSEVLDSICDAGLAEQVEVDERRPTMRLSQLGQEVMKGQAIVPASLRLPFPLAKRLAACAAAYESADMPHRTAGEGGEAVSAENGDSASHPSEAAKPNPQVINKLKSWRRKVTAALGIPAFRVLSNATMERIAMELPTDSEQLGAIKGIGPATVEQFGYDLLEIVASADTAVEGKAPAVEPTPVIPAAEHSPTAQQAPSPTGQPEPPDAKSDSPPEFYWTWRLFSDGYSIEDVLRVRRSTKTAIIDELLAATKAGHPVQLGWVAGVNEQQIIDKLLENPKENRELPTHLLPANFDPRLLELARHSR